MSRRHASSLFIQFVFGLALCLPAATTLAQGPEDKPIQLPSQVESATEVNQRLQQAYEKLGGAAALRKASEARIGPEDLLNISVFEAPEMNCTVRVTASGDLSIPLLGAIHAAGLTPAELESALQETLRRNYMKDPHVGVFVQELQSHPVSVVGAVKTPGVFQMRGSKTLIEVLAMAQGLTDDAGDTILVMHEATGEAKSTDAGKQDSNPSEAAPLFPSADAPPPADDEKKNEIEEVNLKKLLESDDSSWNVAVRPGDIVKVPRAGIVYVVGEVQKPGGFVLQNNERISVLQALALAQGLTHTSAISRARIIRTNPSTGERTELSMNLGKIFSGKARDTLLQATDVVFVPNSAAKSVFYRSSEAALQTAAGVAIYKW